MIGNRTNEQTTKILKTYYTKVWKCLYFNYLHFPLRYLYTVWQQINRTVHFVTTPAAANRGCKAVYGSHNLLSHGYSVQCNRIAITLVHSTHQPLQLKVVTLPAARNLRRRHRIIHATGSRHWIKWLRLWNDLYCVGWGVKLYSLTHWIKWPHKSEAGPIGSRFDGEDCLLSSDEINARRSITRFIYSTPQPASSPWKLIASGKSERTNTAGSQIVHGQWKRQTDRQRQNWRWQWHWWRDWWITPYTPSCRQVNRSVAARYYSLSKLNDSRRGARAAPGRCEISAGNRSCHVTSGDATTHENENAICRHRLWRWVTSWELTASALFVPQLVLWHWVRSLCYVSGFFLSRPDDSLKSGARFPNTSTTQTVKPFKVAKSI